MIRGITTGTHNRVIESSLKNINLKRNISLIDVTNPSMQEMRELHDRFNISLTDLRCCLDPYESARIKQSKDHVLIIYSQSQGDEETKRYGPVGFLFTRRYIVLIHANKLKFVDDLDLNAPMTKQMFHAGTEVILFRILYDLIKTKSKMLEIIEDKLENMESDVFANYDHNIMQEIFNLKNSLIYLKKSVTGNRNVVNSIIKDVPLIKEKSLFAELNVEMMQVSDTLEVYRERLTSILEIHMSNVSNRINVIMKYFTVIASILLMPMLITGLYGMNVVLPFQQHPQAFWIVMGIIVAVIIVTLSFFYNKKWL